MPIDMDIEAEVADLKQKQKQNYINFETDDPEFGSASPEYETEEQFFSSQQEEEQATEANNRFRSSGKLAFQITDTIIPRGAGMALKTDHKEFQADEDDKEDLIDAWAAVFEYYGASFDNPFAQLILLIFLTYGIPVFDAASRLRKQRQQAGPTIVNKSKPRNEKNTSEQEDVEDDDMEDAEVIAEYRVCDAPDCTNKLKPHQSKFCSTSCRMKGLNSVRNAN